MSQSLPLEDVTSASSVNLPVGKYTFIPLEKPNSESCDSLTSYILFTASLVDPLGTDEWAGTDDASKHTQSPRKIRKGGLASGGMDDRFDFQFISSSLDDGKGLDIIEGSYHAMGNDGTHYDIAINDGDNSCFDGDTDRSNLLAQALHDASDHIPVVVDFEVTVVDAGDKTVGAGVFNK